MTYKNKQIALLALEAAASRWPMRRRNCQYVLWKHRALIERDLNSFLVILFVCGVGMGRGGWWG